jgi:integrative and conjugative element protein (TIGR02256 family)
MSENHEEPRIWISGFALESMRHLAQLQFPLETGGMLIGYVGENGESVVKNIIGPGPKARHGKFRFVPDGEYQQSALEDIFLKTEGKETYLGDWHTHPKGGNTPSYIDKMTLAKIAHEPASGTKNPIMAILGDGNPIWKIRIVQFLSARGLLLKRYVITELAPKIY